MGKTIILGFDDDDGGSTGDSLEEDEDYAEEDFSEPEEDEEGEDADSNTDGKVGGSVEDFSGEELE